jgi:clan AA aspartic protease (TIGR02281 family)
MRQARALSKTHGLMLWATLLGLSCQCGQLGFAAGSVAQAVISRSPIYKAGVSAYRQGDYAAAQRCFRQVLSVDGDNVNAHYYLAISLDNLGQGLEAVSDYHYVVNHSSEATIVDYAKTRLNAIQPVPAVKAGEVAMIASGSPMASVVYRGVASQVAVPLKNSKNALIVDAFINQDGSQADGVFIIDTGATYTSISRDMADKLGLDLSHCETVFITTANGRIEVPKVTLQKLNVNGLEAYNVEATVIPLRKESTFSGLLGLSFIRQFVLTIDPQANQLIFRKN